MKRIREARDESFLDKAFVVELTGRELVHIHAVSRYGEGGPRVYDIIIKEFPEVEGYEMIDRKVEVKV